MTDQKTTTKTLFILIGPKGSGKTYIGTLIEKQLKIPFFRVEDVWLTIKTTNIDDKYIKKGLTLIEKEIDKRFMKTEKLIIESTASFDYFRSFLEKSRLKYRVILIQIKAPKDLCLERIEKRDHTIHIPVSDELIEKINTESSSINHDFDLTIDNTDTDDREIIEKFSSIMEK